MKKRARGGSHKGHTKKRTKPAWNKGLTPEMIEARRSGLFMLLIDKPIKNPNRKGRPKGCIPWNKGKTYKNTEVILYVKYCPICKKIYATKQIQQKTCSLSCSVKRSHMKGTAHTGFVKGQKAWNKGVKNPTAASNGKKGAIAQRKTVSGRKRFYKNDGSWTWQYPQSDGSWRLTPQK